MKNQEKILREILYSSLEKKNFSFTQSELSKRLRISLSMVNQVIKRLSSMGAIKVNQRDFRVLDSFKILYYFSSVRNLEKDIIFKIRIDSPVREIERIVPDVVFTAYTAYKLKFDDVPADYSEVYAYADEEGLKILKARLSKIRMRETDNPNLIILKKDNMLNSYTSLPLSQLFADLWNLKEWYAKEFIEQLTKKIKEKD